MSGPELKEAMLFTLTRSHEAGLIDFHDHSLFYDTSLTNPLVTKNECENVGD